MSHGQRLSDLRLLIDGRPLYEEVAAYFEATGKLLSEAHKIAEGVHGSNTLSEPPD